jgi:hypothetical protein
LKAVIRYQPVAVEHAWALANTKSKGVETFSWQFHFDNRLTAAGVWAHSIAAGEGSPVTVVLNDQGKKAAAPQVAEAVNRGRQTVALDLIFHGDAALPARHSGLYPLLIASMGQRALGLEAAQLIAVARWMRERGAGSPVRLESAGNGARWPRWWRRHWSRTCFRRFPSATACAVCGTCWMARCALRMRRSCTASTSTKSST